MVDELPEVRVSGRDLEVLLVVELALERGPGNEAAVRVALRIPRCDLDDLWGGGHARPRITDGAGRPREPHEVLIMKDGRGQGPKHSPEAAFEGAGLVEDIGPTQAAVPVATCPRRHFPNSAVSRKTSIAMNR